MNEEQGFLSRKDIDPLLRQFLSDKDETMAGTTNIKVMEAEPPHGIDVNTAQDTLTILPAVRQMPEGEVKRYLTADSIQIAKLLREAGVAKVELLQEEEHVLSEETSFHEIPEIWITAQLIASNPNVVSVLLGVLSNYIYDAVRGISRFTGRSKLEINIRREDGTSVKVLYEGSQSGLAELEKTIKAAGKIK